jgi:Anti-sigma-K factor rskA
MSDTTPDNHDERDLIEVELLLRSLTADDLVAPPAPPAGVWASIQGELAASGDLTSAAPTVPVTNSAPATPIVSLAERRARRAGPYRWFAAAAAVVLVAAGVAVVATRGGDANDVVATAQLTWDPAAFDPLGENATARAELVERDGRFEIVLTDTALPVEIEEDADLELWLISLDAQGAPADVQPVSLVDPTTPGTYAVPANLDPDTYSVVDISIEPRDGDDAHSGRSILRGQLSA